MRIHLIVAALCAGLASCSPSVSVEAYDGATVKVNAADPGPYLLRVIAVGEGADESSVVLVRGPEGKIAAARVVGAASTVLPTAEAERLLTTQAMSAPPGEQHVAVNMPGLNISVASDDKSGGDGRAQVRMSIAGQEISVDASGEGKDGVANVTIDRASAESAVKFIEDNEKLSPESKAAMRASLGL